MCVCVCVSVSAFVWVRLCAYVCARMCMCVSVGEPSDKTYGMWDGTGRGDSSYLPQDL